MNITKELFTKYIKNFDFKGLFNYLGWDNIRMNFPNMQIKNELFTFKAVAQKKFFCCIRM